MKHWVKILSCGLLAVASVLPAIAQNQPVVGVSITNIAVQGTGTGVVLYNITNPGAGYTSTPTVVVTPTSGGSGATATAQMADVVQSISVLSGGSGYTSAPTVTITSSSGVGATAVANLTGGVVTSITMVTGGTGYTTVPTISFSGGGGSGASASATITKQVAQIIVNSAGTGYLAAPTVSLAGGSPTVTATAVADIGSSFSTPNEAFGPAGNTIQITAAGVGTFTKDSFTYSFFVNGVSIGKTSFPIPPPFTAIASWTPPQPGAYFITVSITDGVNTATSLPVRYFATGTVVNSPVDNTIVPQGSSVVIKADATVAQGFIQQIQFFDNGARIGTADTTYPYSIIYTPPGIPGSPHLITAQATDNQGQLLAASSPITLKIVSPILPGPTSTISSPSNGSSLAIPSGTANITVAVDATPSAGGKIQKVELYIDGVLFGTQTGYPYTFAWHPTITGPYNLVALTYDDKNNVIASTVSTTPSTTPAPTQVNIVSLPTVTLVKPATGDTASDTAATQLQANATDSNAGATISLVEFLQDGVVVAQATSPNSGTNTYSATAVLKAKLDSNGSPVPSVITARATNSLGFSAISAGASVSVISGSGGGGGTPVGNPPVVSVTNPTAATQLPVNQSVSLTASAADSDGNVTSVQFFVNNQSVGTTASYPYHLSWTPANLGSYTITAKAIDNDGNAVTSVPVTVTVVDPSPSAPTVSVTNPKNGATLVAGNPLTLQASATDDVSISQVQFYVNGAAQGAAITKFPYNLAWTPTTPGSYTIAARATDNVGNETTSAPVVVTVSSGSAPSVTLTSPTTNATIGAGTIVNLSASASDADGAVSSVQFLANDIVVATATSAPFLGSWTPTAAGTYVLVAQATDSAGNITTSTPVTITVSGNIPPSVKITSPTFGTSVAVSSSITVNATASDTDGTIASVTFYANGVSIGTDTVPPYSVTWTPTAEGTFRLSAVAIDNAGAATTSDTVIVIAGVPSSGNVDTVASGIYIGAGSSGSFSAINIGGSTATVIGYVPATQTLSPAKTYYFSDIPVDSSGEFQLTDASNNVLISGQFTDSGVSGTFADGNASVTFSGPNTFPQSGANTRPGYYTGSVSDHPGSVLVGLVGVDAHITIYVKDGAFEDSGAGAVTSSGAFSVLTRAGDKITGMIDVNTGLLTGSLKRGASTTTDNLTGAPSSGGSISDGSLRNISTRGLVGSGDGVLIAGFVVNGTSPKHVLIRAIGPSLAGLGVSGAIANPALALYNVTGTQIGYNDDWGSNAAAVSAAAAQVGAYAISTSSHDAALLATLNPGPYTAIVSGVGGTTGVGLVELYDIDTVPAFSDEKMINISTRGQVGTGDNILIAGFVVNGSAPKKVLIRGLGPTLGTLGVAGTLSDPMLKLARFSNGSFTPVRENDNWDVGNDPALVRAAIAKVGASPPLPSGSKDAALLLTLPPGIYSAQLSGTGGATGVGLLEVYEVQ